MEIDKLFVGSVYKIDSTSEDTIHSQLYYQTILYKIEDDLYQDCKNEQMIPTISKMKNGSVDYLYIDETSLIPYQCYEFSHHSENTKSMEQLKLEANLYIKPRHKMKVR